MPAPRSVTKEGTNVWSVSAPLAGGGTNDAYRLFLRNGTVRFDSGSSWCRASTNGSSRNQFDATAFEAGRALGWVIETNSAVTLGSLGVQFGSINPGTFSLVLNGGRLALTAPDNPLGLGDNSNLVISVTVNAGEWRTVSDAAWCDLGTRCPVLWTQNGGLVSFGRPAFGRMNGSGSGRLNGSVDMALNDGTFEAREFFSWKSTDDPAATNRLTLGCGVPLQGRFSVPATTRYHNGGRVIMNLNGGVLEARGLCSPDSNLNGSLNDYLYGVNDLNVLAGGANFDTLTNAVSIRQPLTPDAAGDGGLTKLGSGRLALEADVALTGLVTVAEGTLDAAFTATPDLRVAAAGTLDLSQAAAPCAFRVVSGTGQATNGTLAVTGTLSPGEAEDEAGTLHAQSLALQSGATLRYDWSATTNDLFDVSGELAAQSAGFIDFGREEGDDLPLPFTAVIGRYGTFTGTFSGWKSINTGLPARTALASVIKAENGVVTLSLSYSGLMILIR
jgi:autotransporter-associated beta strand protein